MSPALKFIDKQLWLSGILIASVVVFAASAREGGGGSDAKGLRLAQQVYDRPDGTDVSSMAVMLLGEKERKPRQRILFSYTKDKGSGERSTLMRFVEPTDIEGTGLLTLDHPGDDSDQWLYLPALDRVRRISSSRKGGRFVGSDFFYEDLRDREVDMDDHRLVGQDKVGKIVCELLISTPKDPSNSVYSKRASCIHRKTLISLWVDFYRKGEKQPVKRLKVKKIKKVQGYWTVMNSAMHDLTTGHQTRLVIKKIKYDQGLPDNLFSQRNLSDDSGERIYKP